MLLENRLILRDVRYTILAIVMSIHRERAAPLYPQGEGAGPRGSNEEICCRYQACHRN